jgi:molecular chaperone GrpE
MASEGGEDPASPHEATTPPSERVDELEQRVIELEAQLDQLEADKAQLASDLEERTNTLAKVQADYENYRKRVDQEKREAKREVRAELVEVLAEVLDDVDRALQADPDENVRKGLELVTKRIGDQLASVDAERVEPEPGDTFDPERHEALLTQATDEHDPDTVIELLQPGYAIGDHLVRAARVKVAEAPTAEEAET